MRIDPRLRALSGPLDMDRMNRLFTALIYLGAGVSGSFASALVVGAGVWAAIRLSIGSFSLTRERAAWMGAIALGMVFVAEFVSLAVHRDLPYLIISGGGPLLFLTPLLFYSRLTLSRRDELAFAMRLGAALGAIAAAAIALWFWYFRNAIRIEGFSGNVSVFGLVASVLFAVLVPSVLRPDSGRWRLFWLAGALCAAFATIASGTRALLPALVIIPLMVAWLMREDLRTFGRRRFWLGIAVAAIVVPALAIPFLGWRLDLLWRMFFDAESFEPGLVTPLGARQAIWTAALEAFRQNPWFGVGAANVREVLFSGTERLLGEGVSVSHAHNVFLNYMLRDGLLGLAAIVAVVLLPIASRELFHDDEEGRWSFAVLAGIYVAYLASGMLGLMFGHDVHDALFIYSVTCALFVGCRIGTPDTGRHGDAGRTPHER